ncbi:type I secretion system protein LssZ [Legionella sp. CNM-1927-20]|uniref:type I secretion system protein LssZ n=1 Tax=Legionella sp. CNM-1927-20 TaxID=3422221 RepID=UPI00403A85AE
MNYIRDFIHVILPLISILLLILGIRNKYKSYVVLALWVSIISIALHYHLAGGEILGYYFDYVQAFIYSINLLTLLACIIFLIFQFSSQIRVFRYISSLLGAISIIGIGLLLINLWINASFIENRMPGTPILQVAAFKKLDYCSYRYVFYKISQDGTLKFMCPNHYGLIPSVGVLTAAPDFILRQLPPNLQRKFQSAHLIKRRSHATV